MNILIIDCRSSDCRSNRRLIIKDTLVNKFNCNVSDAVHVDGTQYGIEDWNQQKELCEEYLKKENPDVVLLHIGEDQSYYLEFLSEICEDKIVICFTGGVISEQVKKDCYSNSLHCYYPDVFSTEFGSEKECYNSSELAEIREFLASVAIYLKAQTTDPAAAIKVLQEAKNILQRFDEELEKTLEEAWDRLE